MKNIIYFLLFSGLCFLSCDKRGFTTYDDGLYIQFEMDNSDTTSLTFIFYPYQESLDWPIVLNIIGEAPTEDISYNLVVNPEQTTAEQGKHYSFPNEMIFHANQFTDTCIVKLYKTEDLDRQKVRLVLNLESTSNYQVGKIENRVHIIEFSNIVTQPDWWNPNSNIDYMFLGTYSDKKYALFIQVTGEYDLKDREQNELYYYARIFKRYLEENPTEEEDGSRMTVTVTG